MVNPSMMKVVINYGNMPIMSGLEGTPTISTSLNSQHLQILKDCRCDDPHKAKGLAVSGLGTKLGITLYGIGYLFMCTF